MEEKVFLLYSFLLGLFITFLYDFFIIARKVFPHTGFLISLEDLIFWSYTCIEIFLLMQRQGNGNLRWFAVLGAFAGILLYKKVVSPFFIKIGTKIILFIFLPIKKLATLLRRIIKRGKCFLFGKIKRTGIAIEKKKKSTAFIMKKKLTFFLRLLKMTI